MCCVVLKKWQISSYRWDTEGNGKQVTSNLDARYSHLFALFISFFYWICIILNVTHKPGLYSCFLITDCVKFALSATAV